MPQITLAVFKSMAVFKSNGVCVKRARVEKTDRACGPDERGVYLSPLLFGFVFINDFKNPPTLPYRFRLALS